MKLLISILILLFVLTTISFSGTAYANSCERTFSAFPESREESDYSQGESAFDSINTSRFIEQSSNQNEFNWSDFESYRNSNADWDYTGDLF